jgi:hypothetical protein
MCLFFTIFFLLTICGWIHFENLDDVAVLLKQDGGYNFWIENTQ